MRWKDEHGVRWTLRQRRLAGRQRVKLEIVQDLVPGGLGTDPISFVLALPALVVLAVMLPLWLLEFVIRLLLSPVAAVLRAVGAVPYRLELEREGRPVASHAPVGRRELRRVRTELREQRR